MNAKLLQLLMELGMLVISFLKEKGVIQEFVKAIEEKVADSESNIDDVVLKVVKFLI